MPRRALIAVAALLGAALFGWIVMSTLGRLLSTPAAPSVDVTSETPAVAPPASTEPAAGPRIKATLFFASPDGQRLVGVQQDVPLAEGPVAQARELVTALIGAVPPEPLASTIPEGTTLRGVYISEQQELFVDLDSTLRTKHRGEHAFLYRVKMPVEVAREVLVNYLGAVERLAHQPDWYNAFSHNCTTTIRMHLQHVGVARALNWRIFANGYLDQLMYERGTIDTRGSDGKRIGAAADLALAADRGSGRGCNAAAEPVFFS